MDALPADRSRGPLSLVAVRDEALIVGRIMFSPVTLSKQPDLELMGSRRWRSRRAPAQRNRLGAGSCRSGASRSWLRRGRRARTSRVLPALWLFAGEPLWNRLRIRRARRRVHDARTSAWVPGRGVRRHPIPRRVPRHALGCTGNPRNPWLTDPRNPRNPWLSLSVRSVARDW